MKGQLPLRAAEVIVNLFLTDAEQAARKLYVIPTPGMKAGFEEVLREMQPDPVK